MRAVCAHFLHGHKFFIRLGGMACLNVLQALQFSFLSWHFVYFQHHWKISQRCSLQLQGHKHSWWLLLTFCNTPQLWILSSTSFRIPGCKTWVWTADQVFSVPFSVAKSPQQWRTRPGGPSKVSIPTTNNTVNENSGIFKIKLFLISKVHYWCISTENTYAVLDVEFCICIYTCTDSIYIWLLVVVFFLHNIDNLEVYILWDTVIIFGISLT